MSKLGGEWLVPLAFELLLKRYFLNLFVRDSNRFVELFKGVRFELAS